MEQQMVAIFTEKEGLADYDSLAFAGTLCKVCFLEEAVTVCANCAVDVAIIDCGRAAEAGLRLLQKIKTERATLPVILVTAESSEEIVLRAFKTGARDYFKRPVAQGKLAETVENLLQFKKLRANGAGSPSADPPKVTDRDLPPPAAFPRSIQRAIDYMEEHLQDDVCLDALAREAGMSKFHFCRFFKCRVGLSPMQYLTSRRIDNAQRLLCIPNHTVSMAAFSSGFNDLSQFVRQFKKFTGKTPLAYKKSCSIKVS